ncbi:MAG: TRAP transporter small permease subunit, partial [Acetobacterales bacterium]
VILLLVILSVTLAQVAVRYLLNGSLTWSEELNLFLWVWMILIAAVRTEHMRVDLLERLLPRPFRVVLLTALSLFSLFLLGLLLKGSFTLVQLTWGDYYIALDWLSVRYSFMALTVAGSLWFAVIACRALRQVRERAED